MEGWGSLDAAKTDFDLGTQQYRQVERAAFVGDKKWQEWAMKIMDPQARRTIERFFDSARLEEACHGPRVVDEEGMSHKADY